MKTIPELLSGQFDEELNVLVVEAAGYVRPFENTDVRLKDGKLHYNDSNYADKLIPTFSTSLDACRELLEDLTIEEKGWFDLQISENFLLEGLDEYTWNATARQICVAYLIVKGVLK